MDLKQWSPLYGDEPITIDLRDPFGVAITGTDGEPVRLRVLSPKSAEYGRRVDAIHRAHRERFKNKEPSDEDVRGYAYARLAAALVGWSNNFTIAGNLPAYSEKQALELVADPDLEFFRNELALWTTASEKKVWAVLQEQRENGARGEAASTSGKAKKPAGKSSS